MKKMKTTTKIIYSMALLVCQAQALVAQTPGFTDDVQDVPVDEYIPALLLITIAIAYWFLKPKVKA
jgi:hypothetical protein